MICENDIIEVFYSKINQFYELATRSIGMMWIVWPIVREQAVRWQTVPRN